MLKRFWERRRDDEGFTLIELMVVVLIIGILIAIALPTFLGARARAQDRAAESDLRNGFTAAKTFFTDADSYATFNAGCGAAVGSCTTAKAIEPSLKWDDGTGAAAGTAGVTGVMLASATQVVLEEHSASGHNYCIADDSTSGPQKMGNVLSATYAGCTGTW